MGVIVAPRRNRDEPYFSVTGGTVSKRSARDGTAPHRLGAGPRYGVRFGRERVDTGREFIGRCFAGQHAFRGQEWCIDG